MATIISVAFVALYVWVTDLGAPVERAALMYAVYMLARLFYRERNALNAIGAAALLALVSDPSSLFDAGFQMTFLAVLTIAGVAIPVMQRTTAVWRKALYQLDSTTFDLHLLPKQTQFRVELRMILSRLELLLPRWLGHFTIVGGLRLLFRAADVVFISGIMQAALALPMAVYFHRATTLALPANVAVVPIMSILLPTALGTTLLSYIGSWITLLPRCATAVLLHSVSFSVSTFAHFRAADLRVPDPPAWLTVLCLISITGCALSSRRRFVFLFASLLLLASSDLALIHARRPDILFGKLEITAIDVGQGDSLLVVTAHRKSVLIDVEGPWAQLIPVLIPERTSFLPISGRVDSPILMWSPYLMRMGTTSADCLPCSRTFIPMSFG